jgi:hypothetical protein
MKTAINEAVWLDGPYPKSHFVAYLAAVTVIAACVTALAALTGWFPRLFGDAASPPPAIAATPQSCAHCGVVVAIDPLQPARAGAVLGAVAAGIAGGGGSRFDGSAGGVMLAVLSLASSASGAERAGDDSHRNAPGPRPVRMEDGSRREVDQMHAPAIVVGDRVRLIQGNVVART